MKIFDSNLIIYSSQDEFQFLKPIINQPDSYVSEISKLEVLGYHQINLIDKSYFESQFALLKIIPIDKSVIDTAIDLRQKKIALSPLRLCFMTTNFTQEIPLILVGLRV
jgi:toxin FitB